MGGHIEHCVQVFDMATLHCNIEANHVNDVQL